MLLLHRSGKRLICLVLSVVILLAFAAMPVSAEMVNITTEQESRTYAVIRYSASNGGTVIGNLEDGTPLEVIDETSAFYKIACGGMNGYIAKEQVMTDDNGCYYVNCNTTAAAQTAVLPSTDAKKIAETQEKLLAVAEEQLGVPYWYGGTTPRGFDCSGFVQYVYGQAGYTLTRTAVTQLSDGLIVEKNDLQPGDLVFFGGTSWESGIATHVGIYVGDHMFIHAASSGISYSSLQERYYAEHYICARRVILSGAVSYQSIQTEKTMTRNSDRQAGVFSCHR